MTKLQRIQASLALTAVTGVYIAITAGMRIEQNILAISTTSAGIGMVLGSAAALTKRTWGVGLVFATAVAFASAALMSMGPEIFFLFAGIGSLPMALGAKPFARFDRSAAMLFAGIAIALGVGAALAWHELAPSIWEYANPGRHWR